jgi:hypothetical protein
MAITFVEGFDSYMSQTIAMPKRPWWKKLIKPKRPPNKLYICFFFKGQEWHQGEAVFETPEGTELVEVRFVFYQDGKLMEFDSQNLCIANLTR